MKSTGELDADDCRATLEPDKDRLTGSINSGVALDAPAISRAGSLKAWDNDPAPVAAALDRGSETPATLGEVESGAIAAEACATTHAAAGRVALLANVMRLAPARLDSHRLLQARCLPLFIPHTIAAQMGMPLL